MICLHTCFMKSSVALKLSASATPSGGDDRRSADVLLKSPSSQEGDEKRRLDDATEYSSGWVSPAYVGVRWSVSAAAEATSPTSSGAAEPFSGSGVMRFRRMIPAAMETLTSS